jgi:SDR family mycofactocin-dependent oxidoreductase
VTGRVEGKVALITGAARGQGRSHAVRLAQEGADIIAVDLCDDLPHVQYPSATEDDLKETLRQVEALDRRIVATKADVRDAAGLRAAIDDGVAQLGKLDVVVANAGICVVGTWDDITEDVWDDTVDTNLKGVWNTTRLAAPHLIANGGGSIVMTSSAAGLKGLPGLTPYVASKHGVVGLMHAFATELAVHHIRVNSVHPTGVATPMGELQGDANPFEKVLAADPRVGAMLMNLLPVEITEPVDISNAVLWLASDESRYVTSHTLAVDAGTTEV